MYARSTIVGIKRKTITFTVFPQKGLKKNNFE